jgi:hypothetical protein
MFDKLFNDMPGNSGMPFPFPMNSVVSTVVQAPAANDAHRIDWTGEEPIPAGHFDFERGEGFAIFSSKRGGRETENSAECKYKQMQRGARGESLVRQSGSHLRKLCTIGERQRRLSIATVRAEYGGILTHSHIESFLYVVWSSDGSPHAC